MNIEDLQKVNHLQQELGELVKKHDHLTYLMSNQSGYMQTQVTVIVGQRGYNDRTQYEIPLQSSQDGKKLLKGSIDQVWSEILDLRFQLRELGVVL
jgi:uncharacterized alpha/beta hydrolase family protein